MPHAKGDLAKPVRTQPHRKNYKQLCNAEVGRNSLPQGKAHHLVVQYQMKTYIQSITQVEQIMLRNIYECALSHDF